MSRRRAFIRIQANEGPELRLDETFARNQPRAGPSNQGACTPRIGQVSTPVSVGIPKRFVGYQTPARDDYGRLVSDRDVTGN